MAIPHISHIPLVKNHYGWIFFKIEKCWGLAVFQSRAKKTYLECISTHKYYHSHCQVDKTISFDIGLRCTSM